jgi:hypothetical protein
MPPSTQFWRSHWPTGQPIWWVKLHFALFLLGLFVTVNLILDFMFTVVSATIWNMIGGPFFVANPGSVICPTTRRLAK